jgi:hypothetical protein
MIGLRMAGKSLIIQRNGLPVDDIPEEDPVSTPSSSIQSSSVPSNQLSISDNVDTCWQVNSKLEMLANSVAIFKRFAERQLFLSSIHQDRQLTLDVKDVEPMQVTLDQYPWLENRVLMLACEVIGDVLKDFSGVSVDDKVSTLNGLFDNRGRFRQKHLKIWHFMHVWYLNFI